MVIGKETELELYIDGFLQALIQRMDLQEKLNFARNYGLIIPDQFKEVVKGLEVENKT